MASTNSTTHYELSQYIGTDKPTYLVDYNGDMSKIDTGIYNAQSKANVNETSIGDLTTLETTSKSSCVGAINEVNTNSTNNSTHIGDLTTLTTTEKSNLVGAVNELKTEADGNKTNIGTMANLDTTEKSNLVGAINEVKTEADTNKVNIENFNLSSFTSLDNTHISTTTGTIYQTSSITIAKNSDGSLAKIYGAIFLNNATSTTATITISGSGLTPDSNISIINAGFTRRYAGNASGIDIYMPGVCDITIKTNGDIEIVTGIAVGSSPSTNVVIWLNPYLYFVKDFGDVPIN